jgi:hypothetical protein
LTEAQKVAVKTKIKQQMIFLSMKLVKVFFKELILFNVAYTSKLTEIQ